MFIVYLGNPFDGGTVYGVWKTAADAVRWAERYLDDESWFQVKIEDPASIMPSEGPPFDAATATGMYDRDF